MCHGGWMVDEAINWGMVFVPMFIGVDKAINGGKLC